MDNTVFIEMKDDNGHSLIPSFGTEEPTTFTITKDETPFSMNIFYKYPSSAKGIISVFVYTPTEGFVPTEATLASWSRKNLLEIPIVFGEEIFQTLSDWKTYNNTEANFTFRYPSDWKIDVDYLYETPGGVKAKERTVDLSKEGEKFGIAINERQFPCPTQEVTKWGHTNYIGTCSKDPQFLDIFGKILASFRVKVPVGWKYYKNDVLGISFYYPPEWGDPYTEPSRTLTDLLKINENYQDTGNDFAFMVKIYFSREYRATINICNNKYEGELYPNVFAFRFGPIDNFLEMKKSGDICNYKIKFDRRPSYESTIDEVYSNCSNKVKTYITRNMEIYEHGTLKLYNYALQDSSFVKLQNGYFDNVFINYFYSAIQTPNDKLGLQDLLKEGNENYQKDKENFVLFVNSINVFKPVPPQEKSFQIIQREDSNITTIRKYYFQITKGNLENAYDMYQDKKVSFEIYNEWYRDTLMANPVEFEKIGDNRYQFKVQFQDHNREQELYRVVMEVNEEKIIPISSEKIVTNPISFGNITAFVKQRQSKTYLVLSENGKEQILDQGSDSPLNWEGGPVISGPLAFSPKGNYLMCDIYGWEWGGTNIYDVKNRKIVLELSSPFIASFTPNEKYLFACAQNDFSGESYGTVYSVPDFKEIFNALTEEDYMYMNMDCEYDKEKQVVRFKMYNIYNPKTEQMEKQSKIVEFSAVTGETKTISD
jgi:hypothetical protein